MNKVLIKFIILSVLFAAITEDVDALHLLGKAKAALLLKGAMLAKKAKLAKLSVPKLKKVNVSASIDNSRVELVKVPVQRPNSFEVGHYVESSVHKYQRPVASVVASATIVKQQPVAKRALLALPVVKKLAVTKVGVKKLTLKKAGLKKLALLKKLLG